jgi:rifampicin phosphotransferase
MMAGVCSRDGRAAMMPATWEAPDVGTWHLDDSHVRGAMTPFYARLFPHSAAAGCNAGFRRWGVPLVVDFAVVGGRLYYRILATDPGNVPELERHAVESLMTRRWRGDRQRWESALSQRLREANLELQGFGPGELDDALLRSHLRAVVQLFQDGNRQHFDQFLASTFPVGDFITQASKWTGASPADVVAALQGSSPASAGALRLRDCASPERLAATLDAFLEDHGHRMVTGFDLSDRTTLELPQTLLECIAARLGMAGQPPAIRGAEATATLRDRTPVADRPSFDEVLAEAQLAYGLHDDDLGIAHLWPLGLLRRALLAAAERLVARGAVKHPEHVFEATPAEVEALLGGEGTAPSSDEMAQRAEERRCLSLEEAPLQLGPEEDPLPLDHWPSNCVRLVSGFLTYLQCMEPGPGEVGNRTATRLGGIPASGGRYEGRARVISGPEDFGRLEAGDVLVAWLTSPAYNAVLPLLGAVVTDKGGCLCHTAIVAREFGIPAVVGTGSATTHIMDGAHVLVDGDTGVVELRASSGGDFK